MGTLKKESKNKKEENIQVKSKERVKDFGEVFTNPREVKAMLDLVKDESYRIEATFLEPACGTGNFLVEILDRKLKTVSTIAQNRQEWITLSLTAVGCIYGIDIQKDNTEESQERLLNILKTELADKFSEEPAMLAAEEKAFKFVLKENIIHGNGLTGMLCKADGAESKRELMFSEWNFSRLQSENTVERKLFSMNKMIAHNKKIEADKKISSQAGSLFAMVPQAHKEEEIKPQSVKTHENFINKRTGFTMTFTTQNLKQTSTVLNLVGCKSGDEEKAKKILLICDALKDDEYILNAPLSDIKIMICNEFGFSDDSGNFFFVKLKNGERRGAYKLDKTKDGEYIGDPSVRKKEVKNKRTERWFELAEMISSIFYPLATPALKSIKWLMEDKK